jgi:hypothetical protein
MVASDQNANAERRKEMSITSAKIREENSRLVVDAVVDGVEQNGWVIYEGTSIDHELAALDYLTSAGVKLADIDLEVN